MSVRPVRYPGWVEVCGRRIAVPEEVRYVTYMEERLPIDMVTYCPTVTTIVFPNDADGSLIRLGAMRVGRMWLPAIYKTGPGQVDCRIRGRFYTGNVWVYVHYTIRYCKRPGARTRNIIVDVRIADYFNYVVLRREYLRWLRRYGVSLRCLERVPETTQRRLVLMFYVWYLSAKVQELYRRLVRFILNFFPGVERAGETVEGVRARPEWPPLQVVYIAWGLTTEAYLRYWVYGMYCRCDVTGVPERCTSVVRPWRGGAR
jgi:hypothetical protein